jgi:hypothetical protein
MKSIILNHKLIYPNHYPNPQPKYDKLDPDFLSQIIIPFSKIKKKYIKTHKKLI